MIFGYIKYDSFYKIPIDILIKVFENTTYEFEPHIAIFILNKLGKTIARDPEFICRNIIQNVDGQEMAIYIESLCTSKYVTKEFEIDEPMIPYDYTNRLRKAMIERIQKRDKYKAKLEGITILYEKLKLNNSISSEDNGRKDFVDTFNETRACFLDYVDSYTQIKGKRMEDSMDMEKTIETLSSKMREAPQSKYMCEQFCKKLFEYQDEIYNLKTVLSQHKENRSDFMKRIMEKRSKKGRQNKGATGDQNRGQNQIEVNKKQMAGSIRYRDKDETKKMEEYLEYLVKSNKESSKEDFDSKFEIKVIEPCYKPTVKASKRIKNIFDALSTQNYNEVKKFIEKYPKSVNNIGEGKMTPLIYSARNDLPPKIVELLLTSGASVNAQDYGGFTALHYAQKYSSAETTDVLCKFKASWTIRNKDGVTPNDMMKMKMGALRKSIDLIEERDTSGLFQTLKEWNSLTSTGTGDDSVTLIHVAAMIGSDACIETLIKFGADINHQDGRGRSPLHVATAEGLESTVSLLLRSGADPYLKDKAGRTCFELDGSSAALDLYTQKLARYGGLDRTPEVNDRKEV